MEDIYKVIGMCHGSFKDAVSGRDVLYANLFVTAPFKPAAEGSDYHTEGEKCFVMKCVAPDVFKDVVVGDEVTLYFNQYKKVSYIVPAG